jgi:hypothetical protein
MLIQVTLTEHSKSAHIYKHIKQEMYNNHHFHVKLGPEFFDAKLIICITFPDKPGEGLMQVIDF